MDRRARTDTMDAATTTEDRGSVMTQRTTHHPPLGDIGLPERGRDRSMILLIATIVVAIAAVGIGVPFLLNRDKPAPKPTPSPIASIDPTTQPSPTPSVDAKEQAAARQALAAYNGFLGLDWRAINSGDYLKYEARLKRYATNQALGNTRGNILSAEVNGHVWRGRPKYDPAVARVTLGKRPSVTIVDCLDVSGWEPFFRDTGKSARPPSQRLRLPIISTVQQFDGKWKVSTSRADKARKSC